MGVIQKEGDTGVILAVKRSEKQILLKKYSLVAGGEKRGGEGVRGLYNMIKPSRNR